MKIVPNYVSSTETKQEEVNVFSPMIEPQSSRLPSLRCNIRASSNALAHAKPQIMSLRTKIFKRLDSKYFTIFMTFITIYALFGDDIRIAFFSKSSDVVFFSLASTCMFFFTFELIMLFFTKKNYKWSFYFWLDFVATLSLIPDIGWIWELIIGVSINSNRAQAKSFQNAAKASRIGTRTSRIIRIIRLIRLIRIVKLYKNAQVIRGEENYNEKIEKIDENNTQETYVGMKLSDLINKRIISIVLVMLIMLPIFDTDFYLEDFSWQAELMVFNSFLGSVNFDTVKSKFLDEYEDSDYPLLSLKYERNDEKVEWSGDTDFGSLRYEEIFYESENSTEAIFDIRTETKLIGVLDICRTIFVLILLTMGSFTFSRDTERMIVNPIRDITEKVKKIASDLTILSEKKQKNLSAVIPWYKKCFSSENEEFPEINLIENTITRIGLLLVLVFGEAGTKIIKNSMSLEGEINLNYEGIKTSAIFCFCDIRNFTDVTEVLQEDVMLFVNEIAYIVHKYVYIYQGAANKNIGDAFLLVWKLSDNVSNSNEIELNNKSDLCLICIIKILANLKKESSLQKFRENSKINQRLADYDIRLGFGVHFGWAIEGAVGSEYKIDPSYLSPHVNLTMKLESMSKLYGVQILISDKVANYVSWNLRKHLRVIDVIKINDKDKHFKLYTLDLNPKNIVACSFKDKSRTLVDMKKKSLRRLRRSNNSVTFNILHKSKAFRQMTEEFSEKFYESFNSAFELYVDGLWLSAKDEFEKVLVVFHRDGPSLALLNFMKNNNFCAPSDWAGIRHLEQMH